MATEIDPEIDKDCVQDETAGLDCLFCSKAKDKPPNLRARYKHFSLWKPRWKSASGGTKISPETDKARYSLLPAVLN